MNTDSTTARTSRSLAARRAGATAARKATPLSGSQLIAVLERVWAKVQTFAEAGGTVLPKVHIITGTGRVSGGIRLGHITVNPIWQLDDPRDGSVHELFVSGETLGLGAERALTTILHEATHVLNMVKGVQDTSRQGRYHNADFVKGAATFGLEYTHGKPNTTIGYSAVTLSELGRMYWADEIADLVREIPATIPGLELIERTPGDDSDDRMKPTPAPAGGATVARTPARRRQTYRCACRTLAMFPEDHAAGEITCNSCGETFN